MNLAIDVGNTFIKAGLFEGKELVQSFHHLKEEGLRELVLRFNPERVIISSVAGKEEQIASFFMAQIKVFFMNASLPVPLINLYKTPHTLGMDRLAAASGAAVWFPGEDTLVVDAGTCITYEFVNARREYLGGGISPGIEMRFKALNTFTQKLPLVGREEELFLTGGNTEESIRSGVLNGVLAEVEGIIGKYRAKYPALKVILCGGDTPFFESKIKETIFAFPDLVLFGLNSILIHNVPES